MEAKQPYSQSGKKTIAAVAIAIVVIALVAGLTYGVLIPPQSTQDSQSKQNVQNNSWVAKGAYATYQGQASILSITVSFNSKMEITDLNETHVQISTCFNMSTPFGTNENTTTAWLSRENMTFQPDGLSLNNTYVTQIILPNIGTRSCTVYEYKNQDISATFFIDNELHWPIKMTMTSPQVYGQSYNIDINLIETNIPGL
jgi:type II secretory pathway pseudopilin PulG